MQPPQRPGVGINSPLYRTDNFSRYCFPAIFATVELRNVPEVQVEESQMIPQMASVAIQPQNEPPPFEVPELPKMNIFPEGLQVGMEFDTIEKVEEFMKSAALKQGLANSDRLFKKLAIFDHWKFRKIKLQCQRCQAYIDIECSKESDQLRVKSFDVNHPHDLSFQVQKDQGQSNQVPKKTLTVAEINTQLCAIKPSPVRPATHSVIPSPVPIPSVNHNQERKLQETENIVQTKQEDAFSQLKRWLKAENYQFTVQSNRQKEQILVSSKEMVNIYQLFGELVSLDVMHPPLTAKVRELGEILHVIILNCYDTDMQMIPVAVALVRDLSQRSFQFVLESFYQLTKIPLRDITSDWYEEIGEAVQTLKQKHMITGSHVYSPHYTLRKVHEELSLVCEAVGLYKTQTELFIAIKTTNVRTFEASVNSIMENPIMRPTILKLLHQREKVFYCKLPQKVFVGLRSIGYQAKLCIYKQDLVVTPIEFMQRFMDFEERRHELNEQRFDILPKEVESSLPDPRFQAVRMTFERNVVECFMERYFEALRTCKLFNSITKPNSAGNGSEILVGQADKLFSVKDMKCQCGQADHSGIGCCHEIFAAMKTPSRQYTSLISPRWFRPMIKREPRS